MEISRLKLTIELVPSTAWYKNVRSEIPDDWDTIRKKAYKKANYKCEICGGVGDKWPVECHEVWNYDDNLKTQTLEGFIALCPMCHKAKHLGLAHNNGELGVVAEHLKKVNNISTVEVSQYIEEVFRIWEERSKHPWKLIIGDYNGLE